MTPKTPSIPNPLKQRDPELLQQLTMFRHRLADMLLEVFGSMLNDPRFRLGNHLGPLEDISAAAQVVRVLTKEAWTEADLDIFAEHWRDAIRSALFGDEFEADRHKIQFVTQSAMEQLANVEQADPPPRQPTLW